MGRVYRSDTRKIPRQKKTLDVLDIAKVKCLKAAESKKNSDFLNLLFFVTSRCGPCYLCDRRTLRGSEFGNRAKIM